MAAFGEVRRLDRLRWALVQTWKHRVLHVENVLVRGHLGRVLRRARRRQAGALRGALAQAVARWRNETLARTRKQRSLARVLTSFQRR